MGKFDGGGEMGGKRQSGDTPKPSNGVTVRQWASGNTTIRISFYFRGVRCFETLKLEATSSNLKYASRLRGEILNAIERGTFSYADYFPNSKRAYLFGHIQTNITIEKLLKEFLEDAKSTKETSTYRGYKKVCEGHLFPIFGKIQIKDLQPAMLRKWIRGLNCTTKTASNILTPLRAIIEQALVDQYIKENPLNSIIIDRLLNKETKKSDYKPDPFSIDEVNSILNPRQDRFGFYFNLHFLQISF